MKHCACLKLILGLLFIASGKNYALEATSAVAKDTIESARVYFQFNQDEIVPGYMDNNKAFFMLDSLFANTLEIAQPDSLVITSLVSSEGSIKFNTWLAERRAVAVKDYLNHRYPQLHTRFVLCRKEVDWLDIYDLVVRDQAVPNREEVLQLIEYHRAEPEKCRRMLQYLNGQKPYRYIMKHLLPYLYRTEIRVKWSYVDLVAPLSKMKPASFSVASNEKQMIPLALPMQKTAVGPFRCVASSYPKTVLAIKNNLLYDLALAPNLELEIPVGKRWSLNTEFKCPWWVNDERDYCYQLLSGGIESRLWLGKRHTQNILIGHFLGLYAEGGKYDFLFKGSEEGRQGKYYVAAGLSYGYTKRIARHFAFEFSLGAGYLRTDYHVYTLDEGKMFWKETHRCAYIGLTKAKISLVWLIGTK